MTQPLTYPGVYVNEITPAPGPIQGVSTSTAAFVGATSTAPAEQPDGVHVVTNFTAFKRLFGLQGERDYPQGDVGLASLANAVFGFFNNGGTRAYITRVALVSVTPPDVNGAMQSAAIGVQPTTSGAAAMTATQAADVVAAIPGEVGATLKASATPRSVAAALSTGAPGKAALTKNAAQIVASAVQSVMGWSADDCLAAANAMIAAAKSAVDSSKSAALVGATIDSALLRLLPFDDISIVAAPGLTSNGQWLALQNHVTTGAPNRFAILDSPPPVEANWAQTPPVASGSTPGASRPATSSSSAVYFPWIEVVDPVTGAQVQAPPSGHVAGVYARVDSSRGVFKAPANEQVVGALGLTALVTDAQQGQLNADGTGVNCIRRKNGTILVYGARTVGWNQQGQAADAPFKYVSTRRTFDYIRASLESGTQWAVFEPNNRALWGKIVRNVTSFLTKLWQAGGLFGDTAAQAFYVKCDEETNTPDTRSQGQVITEIGVAITQPAEFVVFNLGVMTQGPS